MQPGHIPQSLPRSGLAGWAARLLLLALATLAALSGPARAGRLPGELPAQVGRLNALAGDVQLRDRDGDGWIANQPQPLRNWPVAEGDRLRTGPDGRAELRIGSTTLRLDAGTELWLQKVDEQGMVLHLQAGTVAVRLSAVDGDAFGPVELITREGRWLPQRPGHYRLDRERDATQASAWRGELHFEGRDSALTIPAGRRADLWLDAPDTTRRALTRFAWAGIDRDGFADWVARDERQDDAPITARHVPPGMSGWQDLDRHGDWLDDSDHGAVWLPRVVAPGWAPFHDGRWAWVSPWGWTWIDAAPWGFAPFHYGSWVTVRGRWAWSPGPRGHRPQYAPALNAWIGGPRVGVTVQIGGHRPPPPRVVVPVVVGRPWHGPEPAPLMVPPRHSPRVQAPVVVVVPPHHDDRRDLRAPDGRRGDRRDEHRPPAADERRDGRARAELTSPRADERRDDPRDDHPGMRRDERRDERWGGRDDRRPGWQGERADDLRGDRRDSPAGTGRTGLPALRAEPERPAPAVAAPPPRAEAPAGALRGALPQPVVRPVVSVGPASPAPTAEGRSGHRPRRDDPTDAEPRRGRDDRTRDDRTRDR